MLGDQFMLQDINCFIVEFFQISNLSKYLGPKTYSQAISCTRRLVERGRIKISYHHHVIITI
jgi:hypothetical protein